MLAVSGVGDTADYLASSALFVKSVIKTMKGPDLKPQR